MKKDEPKCPWCDGSGKLYLVGKGLMECFNCHGSGKSKGDGGRRVSCAEKPWMTGNKFRIRNVKN